MGRTAEDNFTPFPEDLTRLSRAIAEICGFKTVENGDKRSDYKPEAAIVNFYPMDSTLSGHTDHSEDNMAAPLISVSFGQSGVFLIGGRTKETEPVPVFLHSGDVLVMSGESRYCYHAVPKIVKVNISFSSRLFSV